MKAQTSKSGTPLPQPADPAVASEIGRPLNVTDALGYLDAVKVQFHDKPDVYNQFLDIMKDFKSQNIDTPGVISRVSRLFTGNAALIQGFNTFLPVGYRIDVSADPSDPNTITVTTPQGTMTQSTNGTVTTAAAASFLGNLPGRQPAPPPTSNSAQVDKDGNGQFNHAIQYLNKIKARYNDDQDTYKQFLDILQTYKKEAATATLQNQVYLQVQHLFKDAPDLLAEFKVFLGEVAGPPNGVVILPQPSGGASPWLPPDNSASSPAASGAKKPQSSKRKKRPTEKETTPVPQSRPPPPSRAKKAKTTHPADTGSPSYSPYLAPQSPSLPPAHYHPSGSSANMALHPPLPQAAQGRSPGGTTSADKLLFFDRAKKSLENREVYEEFLKLLSLFSKEIIDLKTLIERTKVFLGDGDLMAEFKDLVGWDDQAENVENGPPGSIRTGPPEALLALPADDGEGPSYRRLPDSEIRLACSGRDELCRSVLNDKWVSHPTWASEEAGFVAHKKNSFEEALHKSEEERHEYHVLLEGLARTIAVLEPIYNRIEEMSNEERVNFKLKPDLGGTCKAIYQRTIKRIYGRENINELWQNLQECPAVAVPVVLTRLKSKDEEWRKLQREFARTWREVDSKNFYKSLDHQGITFKANDKKNITARHFVGDIENIKAQQLATWEQQGKKAFTHGSVGHQLEYSFHDTAVLMDTLKMIDSFLDHSSAQYSPQEQKFLRTFVSLLRMCPPSELNAAWGPLEEDGHDVIGFSDIRSGRRSVGSTHSHSINASGVPANDLRRKLLRMAMEKEREKEKAMRKVSDSTVGSRAVSPTLDRSPAPSRTVHENEAYDIWVKETKATGGVNAHTASESPYFTNTTFYTLVRLLQTLYSRFLMCKEIGAEFAEQKHEALLANRVAVELGLDDPNGPAAVLAQTTEILGERGTAEKANVVYMYLIHACDKLFDNELDQATFEEHMRWFFGNKAYLLFTVDKLITALVKQVQTILIDTKCQELWSLLQAAQGSEAITRQDIVRYRREAERHVGQDDNLYKLQWGRETKSMRISLLGAEDSSNESTASGIDRWRDYVNTYVMKTPTEWVPPVRTSASPVFLRRCMRLAEGNTAPNEESWMKIRVDLRTYKLVYEAGGEEVVWRGTDREEEELRERARVREEERRKSQWVS
ncbi:Paired amphipathic helix protein pst1 [Leucoagaricus sp. SymC.cos]|nr:Paired amphipathic helix protein pst1 [Leucoagaricus sp. SymC.cos]